MRRCLCYASQAALGLRWMDGKAAGESQRGGGDGDNNTDCGTRAALLCTAGKKSNHHAMTWPSYPTTPLKTERKLPRRAPNNAQVRQETGTTYELGARTCKLWGGAPPGCGEASVGLTGLVRPLPPLPFPLPAPPPPLATPLERVLG